MLGRAVLEVAVDRLFDCWALDSRSPVCFIGRLGWGVAKVRCFIHSWPDGCH